MAVSVAKNAGSDPATYHYTVAASNTVSLSPIPRSLYVQVAGNVTIVDSGNTSITYAVSAGQVLPFRAIRIHTDTTATLIAWY